MNAIVAHMYQNDPFSQWLGIEVLHAAPGHCKVQMRIQATMCNGFGVAHGGVLLSMADSALAFCANAAGRKAMSIETHISFIKKSLEGEVLIANAKEEQASKNLGRYEAHITNEKGEKVALVHATFFFTGEDWAVK